MSIVWYGAWVPDLADLLLLPLIVSGASATETSSRNFEIISDNQSNVSGHYISKKFQIELNIRLLYVIDEKYFGETFKIYWTRGKKKIDTRKGIVRSDT